MYTDNLFVVRNYFKVFDGNLTDERLINMHLTCYHQWANSFFRIIMATI